jgi:cytochrome c553
MSVRFVACVLTAFVGFAAFAGPRTAIGYKDIKPLLDAKCVGCHGNKAHFGGLNLSSYAMLMKGGLSGKSVIPKKPSDSLLMKRIKGAIKPQMPKMAPPLSAAEMKKVSDWIAAGAKS